MGDSVFEGLWEIAQNYKETSSLFDLKNGSISFVKNEKYIQYLQNDDNDVFIVCSNRICKEYGGELVPNIKLYPVPDEFVEYYFTSIHNKIYENIEPKPNIIGNNCNIHETALIGIEGRKYVDCPEGGRILMKEIGNVVLEDNVDVDAYSMVRRSVMGSTVLRKDVKVCGKVNIGHNCIIGENTLISPGVLIGGSAVIGKNCFIWQGAIVRSHVRICDDVIIGMGSLVVEDITTPGVYVGSPCKYMKKYDKKLR